MMSAIEPTARELNQAWLRRAAGCARPIFTQAGYEVGRIEVHLGLPWDCLFSSAAAICMRSCEDDLDHEIFFSEKAKTTQSLLETLLHEMSHAAVGIAAGHGPVFNQCLKAIGFKVGRYKGGETSTPMLVTQLEALASTIGDPPVPFYYPDGERLGWQGFLKRYELRCPRCSSIRFVTGRPHDADSYCEACDSMPPYLCAEILDGETRLKDIFEQLEPGLAEEAAALIPLLVLNPPPYLPEDECPLQSVDGAWVFVLTMEYAAHGKDTSQIVGVFPTERATKAVAQRLRKRGARFHIHPCASLVCKSDAGLKVLVDLQVKDSFYGMTTEPAAVARLIDTFRVSQFTHQTLEDGRMTVNSNTATSANLIPTVEDLIRIYNGLYGPWPAECKKWMHRHATLVFECRSSSHLEIIGATKEVRAILSSRPSKVHQVWQGEGSASSRFTFKMLGALTAIRSMPVAFGARLAN